MRPAAPLCEEISFEVVAQDALGGDDALFKAQREGMRERGGADGDCVVRVILPE